MSDTTASRSRRGGAPGQFSQSTLLDVLSSRRTREEYSSRERPGQVRRALRVKLVTTSVSAEVGALRVLFLSTPLTCTCTVLLLTLVAGPRKSLSLEMSDTSVYEPQIRALRVQPVTTSVSIRLFNSVLTLPRPRGSVRL